MKVAYHRHFPTAWDNEKVFQYVSSIIQDPESSWKQITGKGRWIFRPAKFFVDGIRDGKKIRVVIEPEGNDILNARGILTAYILD